MNYNIVVTKENRTITFERDVIGKDEKISRKKLSFCLKEKKFTNDKGKEVKIGTVKTYFKGIEVKDLTFDNNVTKMIGLLYYYEVGFNVSNIGTIIEQYLKFEFLESWLGRPELFHYMQMLINTYKEFSGKHTSWRHDDSVMQIPYNKIPKEIKIALSKKLSSLTKTGKYEAWGNEVLDILFMFVSHGLTRNCNIHGRTYIYDIVNGEYKGRNKYHFEDLMNKCKDDKSLEYVKDNHIDLSTSRYRNSLTDSRFLEFFGLTYDEANNVNSYRKIFSSLVSVYSTIENSFNSEIEKNLCDVVSFPKEEDRINQSKILTEKKNKFMLLYFKKITEDKNNTYLEFDSNGYWNSMRDHLRKIISTQIQLIVNFNHDVDRVFSYEEDICIEIEQKVKEFNVIKESNLYTADELSNFSKQYYLYNTFRYSFNNNITNTSIKAICVETLNDYYDYLSLRRQIYQITCDKKQLSDKEINTMLKSGRYVKYENIKEEHDKAVKILQEIKTEYSDADERLFKANVSHNLAYETKDYIFTLPTCTNDLITEGAVLGNCVGGYVDRVIKRETQVVFIRPRHDTITPNAVFEVSNGQVKQFEGKSRRRATKDESKAMREYCEKKKIKCVVPLV